MPQMRRSSQVLAEKASRLLNWYPGHMTKGLKRVMTKLSTVDCVIEVHDARIPFSGRNNVFRQQLVAVKPSLLVLNKSDLADLHEWDLYRRKLLQHDYKDVFLTNLSGREYDTSRAGYKGIGQKISDIIRESDRFNRLNSDLYRVMIVGIPNVGKSTLINRLRQHHLGRPGQPAEVGPGAGVTTAVSQTIKICSSPNIYVMDSPGILHPSSLKNDEEGLRIALCSSISDSVVNVERLADFLLKFLNKKGVTNYAHVFGMKQTTEDLKELMTYGAFKFDMMKKVRDSNNQEHCVPDVDRVCWKFIRLFRTGEFGKVMLDSLEDSSYIHQT